MEDPLKYLTETRGIDPAIAEYAAWRIEGDEYVIPYFDAFGRERTWRYHNPGGKPKYRTRAGDQPHLYCVENVRFGQVILCEGEVDTLSVLSAGLKAVGVGGANSFFQPWVHLLEHVDDLVIAFDGDEAGRQAAGKLKSRMAHARLIEVPEGKDLNDILRSSGPSALQALLTKGD